MKLLTKLYEEGIELTVTDSITLLLKVEPQVMINPLEDLGDFTDAPYPGSVDMINGWLYGEELPEPEKPHEPVPQDFDTEQEFWDALEDFFYQGHDEWARQWHEWNDNYGLEVVQRGLPTLNRHYYYNYNPQRYWQYFTPHNREYAVPDYKRALAFLEQRLEMLALIAIAYVGDIELGQAAVVFDSDASEEYVLELIGDVTSDALAYTESRLFDTKQALTQAYVEVKQGDVPNREQITEAVRNEQ